MHSVRPAFTEIGKGQIDISLRTPSHTDVLREQWLRHRTDLQRHYASPPSSSLLRRIPLRKLLARCAARCILTMLYLLLPLMPLLASVLFMRGQFARHYLSSLRKARLHLAATSEGPLQHYLRDVIGRARQIPDDIHGSCVQCGNCCMERRCAFLEAVADNKYQCGIYDSFWRRFSNCSSFPLNQYDIDRYACPSYYAVSKRSNEALAMRAVPITFISNVSK
jgi:hypothetical protein